MQLIDKIPSCNGCSACVVGCKISCVKMKDNEDSYKYPEINEDGCTKCNNCFLYCPLYNPVDLPEFNDFFEYDEKYYNRDMPAVYRKTMRQAREGHADFVGPLCQVAGLMSLMGNKLDESIKIYPLYCDVENPRRPECLKCQFWKKEK